MMRLFAQKILHAFVLAEHKHPSPNFLCRELHLPMGTLAIRSGEEALFDPYWIFPYMAGFIESGTTQ